MLPDFSVYGYQVIEKLYQNLQGGRITYKALETDTQKLVIIKQFSFATKTWDGYKEIEQEINVLQHLNHQGIPKFLNKFDPGDGLCLVQEYKNAQPLSKSRSFSPEEVKSIVIQLLEILVYLQQRIPPIIHSDIKPENILVEDNPSNPLPGSLSYEGGDSVKVYLIDFGLAKIGSNTMAVSSIMGGTLGFMPPEQVHNQKLTEASDLYSLGASLICLVTNTKSTRIGELVNFSTNKIEFQHLVPQFSLRFILWLEKMVEPDPAGRYQNAQVALEDLQPLDLIRVPEVNLDQLELDFVADRLGQKISKIITVTNNITETILQGRWSVSPHPHDPPHTPDSHSWIDFSPAKFEGNQVECRITINTSQLKADSHYQRQVILTNNSNVANYPVEVKVKTAPLQLVSLPPYQLIAMCGLVLVIITTILGHGWLWINADTTVAMFSELGWMGEVIFGAIEGAIIGAIGGAFGGAIGGAIGGAFIAIEGAIGGPIGGAIIWSIIGSIEEAIGIAIIWAIIWAIIGSIIWSIEEAIGMAIIVATIMATGKCFTPKIYLRQKVVEKRLKVEKTLKRDFYDKGFKDRGISFYVLTTAAVGILIGVGSAFSFNPVVLVGLVTSGLALAGGLIYPPIKWIQLKAEFRRQKSPNLIEP